MSYHTGIKRDSDSVWRRSSDNAEVRFTPEDWKTSTGTWSKNYPSSLARDKYLYWNLDTDSDNANANKLWNGMDESTDYICEFVDFA